MEANKLSQVTDGLQPDWLTGEECLVFEEWYRNCESNPGLLQQMTGTELLAMKHQQFQSIARRLYSGKNKLVLVVV
ncbi:MAG: hypothetical protein ACTHMC_02200 [Pseudobacter sp.]|uniref:hypothetical protein n=1 Tax=Pseudobacter sp. TaxID=2045420 RepID=UPI003F7ECCF6